ncbi:fimbria/pilus outer membrane usher protein [Rivibacter subsaxonicus]|uniref:Outer membrane usher protein n=1 Tax=Rivibacter subsaxonicus TaxID=457575 RepID=A0A4Q7VDR8_9BURK|nr:fimbria/pilus outer membrane usher protein [Rivibacter subsaxonicus]RZT93603.1 outer membrane usher protein [Rivibacter subsaxonicus]
MRHALRIAAVGMALALGSGPMLAAESAPEAESELATLALRLNGALRPDVVYVARQGSRTYLDEASFATLDLVPRGTAPPRIDIGGRRYVELDGIAGLAHRVDGARQELVLEIEPTALGGTQASLAPGASLRPRRPDWGGFLNYSLFGYADRGTELAPSSQYASGAGEAVVFGPYGSGLVSAVANPSVFGYGQTQKLVRLDTNWRYDDVDTMRTVVAGDAISLPGSWGRAVRYAGLQYSSNFSLQPSFISYPLQSIGGLASLPSTVDIYANNVRLASQPVQSGPFAINNMPMITGAGEMSVVVRNAFGQEQVISQPFYVARDLLAPGLSQFAFDLGVPRYNYGIRSADYRGWLGSLVYREGISNELTLEGRAEGDNHVRGIGLSADALLGNAGVLTAGAVASIGERGTGTRLILGFSRQAQWFSFALRSTWASPDAQEVGEVGELGDLLAAPRLKRLAYATTSLSLGGGGSLALALAKREYWDFPGFDVGTLSYSRSAGPLGFFTLALSRSIGWPNQTQVYAGFSFLLGGSASGSAGYQNTRSGGSNNGYGIVSVQQAPPVGEGYGYRLLAQTDGRAEAGVEYASAIGRYGVEVARAYGSEAVRGSISGGVGFLGGSAFLARPITESFGLVRVGGVAGVDVLQDNVVVGRTDADGQLVISRIPAYNASKISIDPLSVPIDASVSKTREWVTSYQRTGVLIDFALRRERNALLRFVDGAGKPLPVGAMVEVEGRAERYPIGFDGEAFVSNLEGSHRLRVRSPGVVCEIEVKLGAADPAVSELGPYSCKGSNS